MPWTITYLDQEKTLEDWGLSDLRLTRVNLGPDTAELIADGRAMDAAEIFPYASTVIVKDPAGARWFYGRVEPWDREGAGNSESQFCVLMNPWWYLREKVFRQTSRQFVGFTNNDVTQPPLFADVTTNRIFLNQKSVLGVISKMTTGEQIREALQWAITNGAPITIGDITPDLDVPIDEIKNIKCDEVLNKMWRWSPDAVFWWDYTTVPYPTIHCKRQPELDAVNLDINAKNLLDRIRIKPRPDWQRPYVLLQFERDLNGYLQTVEDKWPDPLPVGMENQFRGLESVINLQGSQSNTTSAGLVSAAIAYQSLDWWKDRVPWLKSADIATDGITGTTFAILGREGEAYDATLANELVDGHRADWMRLSNGNQVRTQRVRATMKATIALKAGGSAPQEISYDFVATNAATQLYSSTEVESVADPIPVGLAKKIWESLQGLSCEGSFSFVEQEVSGQVSMGNVVNFITPERPEWADIGAMVQSITETAVSGTTEITFGAPDHLTAGELVDLLRVARQRIAPNLGYRLAGQSSSFISLAKNLPEKNSQTGPPGAGGGGGSYKREYDPTKTYSFGDEVRVRSGNSQGVWVCVSGVPITGSPPVWPEPPVPNWEIKAFGVQQANNCLGVSGTIFFNGQPGI